MMYEFPIITNIEQVRNAIKGREEFIEADRDDHIIFNYLVNFEDTFPPVVDEQTAILRECRGLIFDKASGKVIARRYQKFFNLNEKPETQIHSIDWSISYVMLEKLDGSMITPFRVRYSSFGIETTIDKIGTKMGVTDVANNAEKWIDDNEHYWDFIGRCIDIGWTPIFEWCSRKNRIVVDYPIDRLVLTGIRVNDTGRDIHYDALKIIANEFNIDLVKAYPLSLNDALATLSFIKEEEGYIIRFENGHMLKLKGEWYLQMHKTMEHIQHEKDLIRLILDEKLDDAKPFLPKDLVNKIDEFGVKMFHNIKFLSNELAWNCIEDYDYSKSKKNYAQRIMNKDETQIRFRIFDYIETFDDISFDSGFEKKVSEFAYKEFVNKIKSNLSTSTKVDMVRHLFGGIKWLV